MDFVKIKEAVIDLLQECKKEMPPKYSTILDDTIILAQVDIIDRDSSLKYISTLNQQSTKIMALHTTSELAATTSVHRSWRIYDAFLVRIGVVFKFNKQDNTKYFNKTGSNNVDAGYCCDVLELIKIKELVYNGVCKICKKEQKLMCNKCNKVGYCSKKHQKFDKANHIMICKKLKK
jgi:hypothetical protein